MGHVYPGIPVELTLKLKSLFDIRYFVETGTYMGVTATWASQHFERVYTIEASEELWRQTSRQYTTVDNIEFLYGNSADCLIKIVEQLDAPTLFWLDAHWSGGITYGENSECPLREELTALRSIKIDNFILIDDAHLFLAPPPKPHRIEQWPSIDEVITALGNITKQKSVIIVDDVILSVPQYAYETVAEFVQQKLTKEYDPPRLQGLTLIRKGFAMLMGH